MKNNDLHRKYRLFGIPAEILSSTMSQTGQIDDYISFTNLGAERHRQHFFIFEK